jgi:hypothetical protein
MRLDRPPADVYCAGSVFSQSSTESALAAGVSRCVALINPRMAAFEKSKLKHPQRPCHLAQKIFGIGRK